MDPPNAEVSRFGCPKRCGSKVWTPQTLRFQPSKVEVPRFGPPNVEVPRFGPPKR